MALHPRLQSRCVQWAADAREGGHGWHLFGTWYWFLVLPVLTVPLVAIVLVWRRRRRA